MSEQNIVAGNLLLSSRGYVGDTNDLAQQLRESEERYHSLVGALTQIVWTADASGRMIGDTSSWCAFTGQSHAEVSRASGYSAAIHPEDRRKALRSWQRALLTRRTYEGEYRLRRYDGQYHLFSTRAVPMFETDGTIREWIVICTDVTQRKQEEEEREKLLQRGQEALEAEKRMEEFLGIASHELRTPLTTIKANIQLAQRRLKSALVQPADATTKVVAAQDMLERAERQVGVLNGLVGDMIDISRIQSGRLEQHLNLYPCDMLAIVCKVVQELRKATPARVISLDMPEIAEVMVLADAERIAQVVKSYLGNALKYSEANTPVIVSLTISAETVRVLVQDEGQGLSESDQERIWECFYQSPDVKVLSGSGVGLGLGLYISKMLVEHHNGQVGVESTLDKGSTFWFTLPITQTHEPG